MIAPEPMPEEIIKTVEEKPVSSVMGYGGHLRDRILISYKFPEFRGLRYRIWWGVARTKTLSRNDPKRAYDVEIETIYPAHRALCHTRHYSYRKDTILANWEDLPVYIDNQEIYIISDNPSYELDEDEDDYKYVKISELIK